MKRFILYYIIINLTLPMFAQIDYSYHKKAEEQANMGMKLLQERRYEEAFPLINESWHFYSKHIDSFPIDYANLAHILGQCYMINDNYEKAEEYFFIAINTLKNKYKDDYVYRSTLTDIGIFYYTLHNYDKANQYFSEAKYLFEKNLDLGYRYAILLTNYSLIQNDMGKNLLAKMYVDLAMDIFVNSEKKDSVETSTLLSQYASTYYKLGFIEDAISIMRQALDICPNNNSSGLLSGIGTLYFNQKNYKEALNYYKKSFDLNHAITFNLITGTQLAWTQHVLKDKNCFITSQLLSDSIISDVMRKFTFLSNRERESYWSYNNINIDLLNTIFANANTGKYIGTIYNNCLFTKGLLLKTSKYIKREISLSGDDYSKKLISIMNFLEKEINKGNYSAKQIEQIKDSLNNIDKLLTKNNASYQSFKKELLPDWTRIKKSLDKNEAAIEFVQIPIIEHDSIPESFIYKYYGMIIKKNSSFPILVPLCTDLELQDILVNRNHLRTNRYISNLYTVGNSTSTFGDKLYNNVWAPLEKELKGIKIIYYSPIGQLNSISFNALMNNSICLSDRFNLHLLSSTAEIVQLKRKTHSKIENAIIYGGIAYDLSDAQMIAEAKNYETTNKHVVQPIEEDRNRSGWNYLPGTVEEVKSINATLDSVGYSSVLYLGAHANEESFKSLSGKSPHLLHIATHGFFLNDPKQIAVNPFLQEIKRHGDINYLLRSGLLFAGANKKWVHGNNVEGIEDGVLTAEEISNLDLSSTEVVSLSACETGLGEIVSSEGVFGLQRAFKLSGVKTLIMSLWKVPDNATSKLMISFYKNWSSGMEIHQAFQSAQKKIKEKYPSPYYWAGFVMLD